MLIVRPHEARLPENFKGADRTEPYCLVTLGDCQIKGMPCKKGGTTPTWRDNIVFHYKEELWCYVQVKDRYVLTNDGLIGACVIDLDNSGKESRASNWYDLYYRKNVVGQILIEFIYPATSQDLRFINPKAQDITKQSKEQMKLLERNMSKHVWDYDDVMVLTDEDIHPLPLERKTVPMQERNPNTNQENIGTKQVQSEVTPKFCGHRDMEAFPRGSANSIQFSNFEATPSKSLPQLTIESAEKEKKQRKKSIGRKILDSVKKLFTINKSHGRKQSVQSVQVEPIMKGSPQRIETKVSTVSPIKVANQESDQSSISTIKSIVYGQKNEPIMEVVRTEPALVLHEDLDKEGKSVEKQKMNFSVTTLVLEDKENNILMANRTIIKENTPMRTRKSEVKVKSPPKSARNNLEGSQDLSEQIMKVSMRNTEKEKEDMENKENAEPGWLEMVKKGYIIIEDLSNNEKRILEIKPTRMSLERETVQSNVSCHQTGASWKKTNADESLRRHRRLYR